MLGMLTGRPPRNTAAAELDVPRSIPIPAIADPPDNVLLWDNDEASRASCSPLPQQLLCHGALPRLADAWAASPRGLVGLHDASHPRPPCPCQPAPRAVYDNLSIKRTVCALAGYATGPGVCTRWCPVKAPRSSKHLAWRLLALGEQTDTMSKRAWPCGANRLSQTLCHGDSG